MYKLSNNSQPPVQSAKRKINASQVIPIIILIGSVIGGLYFSGFFDDMDIPLLTPTRPIEGTWKTTFATEFTIATDFSSYQLADVGTQDRMVTFTITGTSNENTVNVKVEYSSSNSHFISDSGYVPDVSPMFYIGTIDGTKLTLNVNNEGSIGLPLNQVGSVGEFTFTSTQMQGTWHDHWDGVYEQSVTTATNSLKLMKQ